MFYCLGPVFVKASGQFEATGQNRVSQIITVTQKQQIKIVLGCVLFLRTRSNCPLNYARQTPSGPMMSELLFIYYFVQIKCYLTLSPHSFSVELPPLFCCPEGVELYTFILLSFA